MAFVAVSSVAAGIFLYQSKVSKPLDIDALQTKLKRTTVLPVGFKPVPEFQLTNQDGKTVGAEIFNGHWSLVFFGYTFCPDICPSSLATIKQAKEILSENPSQPLPNIVFVSVDPARDTPEKMKDYLDYFGKDLTGLSGSDEQTLALTRSLGIIYKREDNSGEKSNYLVDHAAFFLLINPKGELQALLSAPHNANEIAHDYTQIVTALSS